MTSLAKAPLLSRLGALGSAGALVSVAAMAVNGLAYLPPLLAARVLTADQLGALAALLAIAAIASVPGLGLQTALAVRWARQDTVPAAGRVAVATAGVTAVALLVAAPVLAVTLHIPVAQPILLAVLTFPVVLAGFWLGELQGRQRFGRLALGMVILAVDRFGGLVVALAAGLGVTASLAIGAAGAWVSIVALRWLARPVKPASAAVTPVGEPLTVRDVTRAATATLAMLATSYADLILARSILPAAEAGAYSVGAVLTKGALWAPAVVTVLALPHLARGNRRALAAAAGCVAASGAVLVLASAGFGGLAMRVAGGAAYTQLGRYAVGFAAVGALYALVFVFVNAGIAAGSRWAAGPLWAALCGLVVAVRVLHSPDLGDILLTSLGAALAATVGTVALVVVVDRRRTAGPIPAPDAYGSVLP
jgi:O-antigen/teichoic acid export membrane protein